MPHARLVWWYLSSCDHASCDHSSWLHRQALGGIGIVGVLACAFCMGHYAYRNLSPMAQRSVYNVVVSNI